MVGTLEGLLAALWWNELSDEQKEQIAGAINDTHDWVIDLGLRRGQDD